MTSNTADGRPVTCALGHPLTRAHNGTDSWCLVCRAARRCSLCGILFAEHPRCGGIGTGMGALTKQGCGILMGPGHITDSLEEMCKDCQRARGRRIPEARPARNPLRATEIGQRYWEGAGIPEIAEQYGLSMRTVYRILGTARAKRPDGGE